MLQAQPPGGSGSTEAVRGGAEGGQGAGGGRGEGKAEAAEAAEEEGGGKGSGIWSEWGREGRAGGGEGGECRRTGGEEGNKRYSRRSAQGWGVGGCYNLAPFRGEGRREEEEEGEGGGGGRRGQEEAVVGQRQALAPPLSTINDVDPRIRWWRAWGAGVDVEKPGGVGGTGKSAREHARVLDAHATLLPAPPPPAQPAHLARPTAAEVLVAGSLSNARAPLLQPPPPPPPHMLPLYMPKMPQHIQPLPHMLPQRTKLPHASAPVWQGARVSHTDAEMSWAAALQGGAGGFTPGAHGGSWAQMFASSARAQVPGAQFLLASHGDTRKKKSAPRSYNFVPPSEVESYHFVAPSEVRLEVASSRARLQEGSDGGDGKEGGGGAVKGVAAGEEGASGKETGGGGEKEKEQAAVRE